jgi:putative flippase GtrA
MKKLDIILALITGEGVAWLFVWLIQKSTLELVFLNWLLPILFPILALCGLWIAYLIGKKYLVIFQLAKFLLIGALFALFDLVILNFLIGYFEIARGVLYSVFITISFIIANSAKYIADKYWTFKKYEREGTGIEFTGFFIVTLIGGGIHIMIASLIVNSLGPQFEILPVVWANIGKIIAITIASAWNFVGYKFLVFKK